MRRAASLELAATHGLASLDFNDDLKVHSSLRSVDLDDWLRRDAITPGGGGTWSRFWVRGRHRKLAQDTPAGSTKPWAVRGVQSWPGNLARSSAAGLLMGRARRWIP